MAALTAPFMTKRLNQEAVLFELTLPVKAATTIYAGATVATDATGYAVPATAATGLKVWGVSEETVDNSTGANGAKYLKVRCGAFTRDVGTAGDALGAADIGATVYAMDDHTVGKVGTSRSPAGIFLGFETDGTPFFLINYQATKAIT
jgi:hypothetical protein